MGALTMAFGLLCTSSPAHGAGELVLATASPGGTYYPVGSAIATLVKAALSGEYGINMVAIPTAGSVENIALLERGEVDFAIVQALVCLDAWNGVRRFADAPPRRSFRAVASLWRNVEQFVLRTEFVKTGTIEDLLAMKGAKVALGGENSGTLLSNRILLGNLGVDMERQFSLVFLGYGAAAQALQAREIVAMGVPAGVPTKSLTRAKAAVGGDISILSFTPAQAKRADGGLGLWSPHTIPAHTYPDQPQPVSTIAQPNLLVVNQKVSEETVYRIISVILENREFLGTIHEATDDIDARHAGEHLPVPLHPGARRYFEEEALRQR